MPLELRNPQTAETSIIKPGLSPYRSFSQVEREQWQREIADLYRRMREKSVDGPYDVTCGEIEIRVLPHVYAPRFFTDSLWFAEQLPLIVGRSSLLEIGTGTGLIAIACAKRGARAIATDINPDAVQNARVNVARHNLEVSVRQGSLYDPLERDEKFDHIFWAHPFNNWDRPEHDMLLRSGRDYHYEGLRGYVMEARDHLSIGGKLLLGTGDSADLKTLNCIAWENRYSLKLLAESKQPLGEGGDLLVKYLLYEFVAN